jgi:hypothetical protein
VDLHGLQTGLRLCIEGPDANPGQRLRASCVQNRKPGIHGLTVTPKANVPSRYTFKLFASNYSQDSVLHKTKDWTRP